MLLNSNINDANNAIIRLEKVINDYDDKMKQGYQLRECEAKSLTFILNCAADILEHSQYTSSNSIPSNQSNQYNNNKLNMDHKN